METERCKELRMMLYSDMKEGIVSKIDYVELHAAYMEKGSGMQKRVSGQSRKKWITCWKKQMLLTHGWIIL